MRALAIVAIVALGPSVIEARAADLRVGGPAIRGPEYVYEQVPVCDPSFYGACVPPISGRSATASWADRMSTCPTFPVAERCWSEHLTGGCVG